MAKVTGQVMKSNGTQQVTPVVYYSRPVTRLGHIESAASQRQVDTDVFWQRVLHVQSDTAGRTLPR